MKSDDESGRYPTAEEALAEIGEKPVAAFSLCVTNARRDLQSYREAFPDWVAEHSERGLANWISDRIWAHLGRLADAIPGMEMYESGVTREVIIGLNYRFRVKRHDEDGKVASYETSAFLEFVTQSDDGVLPGMKETRLIAGYDWVKELRNIGSPVVSLRDGKDNIIWKELLRELPDEGYGGAGGGVIAPDQDGPTGPTVDLPDTIGKRAEEAETDE